ncbi:MAG: hypothetical protein Q8M03_11850 [Legionella sp.]|nr:hypothetical protein [Legionella sp.]
MKKFLRIIGFISLRASAMLAGMVYFPLRALFFGSILALGGIVIGTILLGALTFVAPFLLAGELMSKRLSIGAAILFIPIASLLFFVITIAALPVLAIVLCAFTPFVLLDSAWKGIKAGFLSGFSLTCEDHSLFEIIFYEIKPPANKIAVQRVAPVEAVAVHEVALVEEENADEEVWQEVQCGQEKEAPVSLPEIPDMESTEPLLFTSELSSHELKTAKKFITLPNASLKKLHDDLESLRQLTERYIDLSKNLADVQKALKDEDLSTLDDQLNVVRDVINTPILFEKQYYRDNSWHPIPVQSYITDKEELLHWFKVAKEPTHPFTMDSIIKPDQYGQMATRYRWRELTVDDCQSQELFEAAEQIKDLLQKISKAPIEIHVKPSSNEMPVRPSSWDSSFFGGGSSSSSAPSSYEPPRPGGGS